MDTAPQPAAYHRRRPLYRTETMGEREEGQEWEPLQVTYRINLSFVELDAIPTGRGVTIQAAWQAIAPYVTGWNIAVPDPVTGESIPVPPPAEGGWEVMKYLDGAETVWLLDRVKHGYLKTPDGEPDRGNASTESEATPTASNDSDSEMT